MWTHYKINDKRRRKKEIKWKGSKEKKEIRKKRNIRKQNEMKQNYINFDVETVSILMLYGEYFLTYYIIKNEHKLCRC